MSRPELEIADVVRLHGDEFLAGRGARLSHRQRRVLRRIGSCRTAALGVHALRCRSCDHEKIAYNSCRDRHCPKCGTRAGARWIDQRRKELLPVQYFHVVFTVPAQVAAVAIQNKRLVYGMLFRAVGETIRTLAADPRLLGAVPGFFAVLHTWSQTLIHHPHVHCVIPGGGLFDGEDGWGWVGCRKDFFLPVQVLSKLFRGKLLALLQEAYRAGEIELHGSLEPLRSPAAWAEHLRPCYRTGWVVYAKPPFGGPAQVLRYLAGYTHRIALSNWRLLALEDGKVTFRYRDHADGQKQKAMTLPATEFLRRFLLHVLPRGFVRIRYFGFLANAHRKRYLDLCRKILQEHPALAHGELDGLDEIEPASRFEPCPRCGRPDLAPSPTPLEPPPCPGGLRMASLLPFLGST